MLKWKWVALALVTSTLSANAEESSKEKFLNNYGRMLVVEARCPSWKINEQKVVEILNFFKIANADIEPGGHDWPAIERSIHSNQRAFAGIGPKMMCVKANAMYGPKGAVSPGSWNQSEGGGSEMGGARILPRRRFISFFEVRI